MSKLNPPIQRRKLESTFARIRGSSRPTLPIETQNLRKQEEEEAEREWAKQQRVSAGSGKGYTVSVECNARQKKGPPDCMKKPDLDENLKSVEEIREHGL